MVKWRAQGQTVDYKALLGPDLDHGPNHGPNNEFANMTETSLLLLRF